MPSRSSLSSEPEQRQRAPASTPLGMTRHSALAAIPGDPFAGLGVGGAVVVDAQERVDELCRRPDYADEPAVECERVVAGRSQHTAVPLVAKRCVAAVVEAHGALGRDTDP